MNKRLEALAATDPELAEALSTLEVTARGNPRWRLGEKDAEKDIRDGKDLHDINTEARLRTLQALVKMQKLNKAATNVTRSGTKPEKIERPVAELLELANELAYTGGYWARVHVDYMKSL